MWARAAPTCGRSAARPRRASGRFPGARGGGEARFQSTGASPPLPPCAAARRGSVQRLDDRGRRRSLPLPPHLPDEAKRDLSLLARLRRQDLPERRRARVALELAADATQIRAPEQVEDLSNQFNPAAAAKVDRLAAAHVEAIERVRVDLIDR